MMSLFFYVALDGQGQLLADVSGKNRLNSIQVTSLINSHQLSNDCTSDRETLVLLSVQVQSPLVTIINQLSLLSWHSAPKEADHNIIIATL